MSIDPKRKYTANEYEVTHLTPIWNGGFIGKVAGQLWRWDSDGEYVNQRSGASLTSLPHCGLREVDPVLYYSNHLRASMGGSFDSFRQCMRYNGDNTAIARTATHASGKVRQIPLDATEDPEGGAA